MYICVGPCGGHVRCCFAGAPLPCCSNHIYCVCMCVCTRSGGQSTSCESQFSPIIWAPGLKHGSWSLGHVPFPPKLSYYLTVFSEGGSLRPGTLRFCRLADQETQGSSMSPALRLQGHTILLNILSVGSGDWTQFPGFAEVPSNWAVSLTLLLHF